MDDKKASRRTFMMTTGAAALGIGVGFPVLRAIARDAAGAASEEGDGPRWAMVVDRAKCPADCNECSKACHLIHNVPCEENFKKDLPEDRRPEDERLKWIWKEPFEHALPNFEQEYMKEGLKHEPTIVFCNHCEKPPCVRVCPTQATWKREDGVVMMDMHRCIGCRYCIVGCPYGSRSFNWRDPRKHLDPQKIDPGFPTRTKGVVEKCNLCAERLAKGEKPKCVEACPHGALTFGNVRDKDSPVRKLLKDKYTVTRKTSLGTRPHVFYIVGGDNA